MWFPWLPIGLILGGFGGWAYSTFVLGRATGQLLVDVAVQRALIEALLSVCEPYHDDQNVAAVIRYVKVALGRLERKSTVKRGLGG